MSTDQGITRELGFGEVISKTFGLYRSRFASYFALFAVVYAIYGAVLTAVNDAVTIRLLPPGANATQVADWFRANAGPLVGSELARLLVLLAFVPVIYGGAIKMASDQIKSAQVNLVASVRFSLSKLIWVWILVLVVGVVEAAGLVALIVPGIILAIMFSLVLPVLIIENTDIVKTMSRSRTLVGNRWLKTFVVFFVVGIIIVVAGFTASAIGGLFGPGATEVTNILSAFYLPIVPISLTVYYYSNLARVTPAPAGGASFAQPAAPPGTKFCTNCGEQLNVSAAFCSKCGAKQPA